MSTAVEVRGVRWLVALARVLLVAALLAAIVLILLAVLDPQGASASSDLLDMIGVVAAALAITVVGCLLAARLPRHAVPWLLAVPGLVTLIVLGPGYHAFDPPSTRGDATILMLLNALFFVSLIVLVLLFPLLFPDGRLVGSRWRWVLYLAFAVICATALWALFDTNTEITIQPYLAFGTRPGGDVIWGAVGPAVQVAGLVVFALGASGLFIKYRRGSAVFRKQMLVPFVVLALWLGIGLLVGFVLKDTPAGELWANVVTLLAATVFAGAIVVSVTRYGLYEVDRLVNRTIVYTIVVVLLGALFAAGALWLPSYLPGNDSSVAVAASTLAVAALFTPLRRRVQRFVDRRFYRSRYDAQRVADDFATGLRDELDADVVAAKWVGVIQDTLQPSAVSVWVREGS